MQIHRRLGTEQRMRQVAFAAPAGVSREWDTGNVMNELDPGEAIERRYGAPYLLLHCADLHAIVESVLPPGIVQFERKLIRMDQDARGVTLAFADGAPVACTRRRRRRRRATTFGPRR